MGKKYFIRKVDEMKRIVQNLAKEVWQPEEGDLPYEDEAMRAHAKSMVFPIGQPNDEFA